MRTTKVMIVLIVILAIVIPCNKFLVPTFGEYSKGERAGVVQKMTEKGMFFKTFEGELALEGIKATGKSVSSVFAFSVQDPTIADSINKYIGKPVKVYYTQYWHVNAKDGDSEYHVTKVEAIK